MNTISYTYFLKGNRMGKVLCTSETCWSSWWTSTMRSWSSTARSWSIYIFCHLYLFFKGNRKRMVLGASRTCWPPWWTSQMRPNQVHQEVDKYVVGSLRKSNSFRYLRDIDFEEGGGGCVLFRATNVWHRVMNIDGFERRKTKQFLLLLRPLTCPPWTSTVDS